MKKQKFQIEEEVLIAKHFNIQWVVGSKVKVIQYDLLQFYLNDLYNKIGAPYLIESANGLRIWVTENEITKSNSNKNLLDKLIFGQKVIIHNYPTLLGKENEGRFLEYDINTNLYKVEINNHNNSKREIWATENEFEIIIDPLNLKKGDFIVITEDIKSMNQAICLYKGEATEFIEFDKITFSNTTEKRFHPRYLVKSSFGPIWIKSDKFNLNVNLTPNTYISETPITTIEKSILHIHKFKTLNTISLTKSEASLLYIELHKFIFDNK